MRRTRVIAIVALLGLVALLAWRALGSGSTGATQVGGASVVDSTTGGLARSNASPVAGAAAGGVPASLRGTSPDGGVRFDTAGRPVADAELRRLLDWYLAAIGEQDLDTIRARLQRDMALRMTPPQLAGVMALFDRYVAYQQASTRRAGIGDLAARLEAVHALRVRMLGADAAAGFFGEEETEARRVLALQQAQGDASLTDADHAALQASLDAMSPGYAQARADTALRTQVQRLDAQFARDGASAAERHAERTALLGAEAADRFETLDAQRAQWQTRVTDYATRRAALAQRRDLSTAQREVERRRLMGGFSAAEQRRIAALDEAGALR